MLSSLLTAVAAHVKSEIESARTRAEEAQREVENVKAKARSQAEKFKSVLDQALKK